MKTVTICGSVKFADEMKVAAFELEAVRGCNVLQCVYNVLGEELSSTMLENLKNAHYRKIELSDAVYVMDIGGYLGEAVKGEIAYAKKLGKEVIFHSKAVWVSY